MRRALKAKGKKVVEKFGNIVSGSRSNSPSPRNRTGNDPTHDAEVIGDSSTAHSQQPTVPELREGHSNWVRARVGLTDALKLAEKAGNVFPGASAVFGGLIMVLEAVDKTDANSSTVDELQQRVLSLLDGFNKARESNSIPGLVEDAKRMIALLKGFFERMKDVESEGFWKRLMDHNLIESDLTSLSKSIDSAVIQFILDSNIRLEKQIQSSELSKFLDSLPHVPEASYRSAQLDARSKCFEDTRAEVINRIEKWAQNPNPKAPSVFWLNGMAGIGKSTVAQSVSERAYDEKILGATFFFSRKKARRNGTKHVIPSLAYQLAQTSPEFKHRIGVAVQNDPMVGAAPVLDQLKKLIVDPLSGMDPAQSVVLIVVDALDECESKEHAKELLKLFVTFIPQIPFPFRILITSRPEPHISAVLKGATDDASIVLHDIEKSVVKKDITRYLQSELAQIVNEFSLPRPWPNESDVEALAEKAGKLFIYATTSIRFLSNDVVRNPVIQLKKLLHSSGQRGTSSHADLDLLYDQVLSDAVWTTAESSYRPPVDEYILNRYRMVVGAIVLLRDPLPIRALAQFLGQDESDVRAALHHLQSVIIVPSSDSEPLSIYHPSFPDFITDPKRCTDAQLRIDHATREQQLTTQCLELLNKKLQRDIAGICNPSLMNEDITDLHERVTQAIPAEVRYACVFWTEHLCSLESIDDEVMKPLRQFVSKCMLWWFESLSLLENVAAATTGLRDAHQWAIRVGCDDEITSLLYDGYRFILAHSDIISTAALHVYYSALPFTPRQSNMWKKYKNEATDSASIWLGVPQDWSPCLRVFDDPSSLVTSVVFSADGRHLASGSQDKMVRLWDVAAGKSTVTLEGHSHWVTSVAFSADGRHLASGSDDKTVRLWDVATGKSTATLEGHSHSVTSVAFSTNGRHLASGSYDWMVRLWDVATGKCTATLEGHSDWVTSVAFSADSRHLASGSEDSTVRLWDVATGRSTATLEGHSNRVTSVAFSVDDRHLASGSEDSTVRLWDVATGKSTATLKGHSHSVWSVAFSADNRHLASGSLDYTVRLWDVPTGKSTVTLEGHSSSVRSVAFSADGQHLASGSHDKTVRLWDVATGKSTATLEGHSYSVRSLTFSADGRHLASGSFDNTVRLWDVATGKCTATLEGHSDWVTSVAFSAEARHLASGSHDKTVRLWDVATGKCTATLEGHSSWVTSVAFSADGTQIISRSFPSESFIWDIIPHCRIDLSNAPARLVEILPNAPCQLRIEHQWLSYQLLSGSWSRMLKISSEYTPNEVCFTQLGYQIALGCVGGQVLLFGVASAIHSILAASSHEP